MDTHDEIERLRAVNAALREALQKFVEQYLDLDEAYSLARAALLLEGT